jgi:hypothetical protein
LVHQLAAVPADLSAVKDKVGSHQCGIEHIKPYHNVVAVQRLMDDAEDVAQYDQGHEKRAFPNHHLGAQRLGDGNGPADRETEQKEYFPNAEICHSFILENVVLQIDIFYGIPVHREPEPGGKSTTLFWDGNKGVTTDPVSPAVR